MRRSARLIAIGVAALTALALTACSGGEVRGVRSGDTSSALPASGKVRESTFVYVQNLEVVTEWDPAVSYSNEIIAMQNIYESLTIYNPVTRKAGPRLATSWTASPDSKTWTFTLRSGAKFHSGRVVDSSAVKSSIERTMRLGAAPSYIWDSVDTITTPDANTVVFNLKYPEALDMMASASYAAYIYDTEAAKNEDLGKWFAQGNDAGSGPYRVAKWQKGKEAELRLTAFEEYWGGWEGLKYKNIEFRVVQEHNTAWQLLQRGEATFIGRLTPQLFDRAADVGGIRTMQVPSFQTMLMLFNSASGPMQDIRVRKAVQKAIDYPGVIRALKGAGAPASGLVPESMLGYKKGQEPVEDLAGAQELLTQAGYGPGRELRLTLTYAAGDDDQRVLATLLTSMLARVNITLDARAMSWEAQWGLGKSKDTGKRQDIFVMYWWPDVANPYSWFVNLVHSGDPVNFNLTYIKNAQLDEKIQKLPALTATNRRAAQDAYEDLQHEVIEERALMAVPWVVNYQRAYAGGVRHYTDNPAYPNVVFVHSVSPSA
ncbi:ABC transporter substrate-binding protein [Sinosporangium siamense]|uniref:Peptide ABC transporter substrate-binding protein n=1 Tax=Sinosporangium siamense TaxID=1367973 RepID=A0A919RDE0_9ACTN|nr:ABC transporter substrate-binding protein [Sinosporangium siamense]GII91866.1 peptide ABC transporter substrate-binding protein [Sinosporangium siamense]